MKSDHSVQCESLWAVLAFLHWPFFLTGMWNQIFLGSYMSLFVAIPFAYFFTESEGFAGSRKVSFHCSTSLIIIDCQLDPVPQLITLKADSVVK